MKAGSPDGMTHTFANPSPPHTLMTSARRKKASVSRPYQRSTKERNRAIHCGIGARRMARARAISTTGKR